MAPDLYFNAPPSAASIWLFQVAAFDAGDLGTVTIEGDPADADEFVHLGVPVGDAGADPDPPVVSVPGWDLLTGEMMSAVPLVVSNAWLHGTLFVTRGATIQLGPLPVHFGSNGWAKILPDLSVAIDCPGDAVAPPLIFDTGSATVQIDDTDTAIQTGGTCDIMLQHGPRIGSEPSALFDGGCPPAENTAANVTLGTHLVLGSIAEPAVLSCQQQDGVSS